MTFHVNEYVTVDQIAALSSLARDTRFADRVGKLSVHYLHLAEDRQRDAFMFQTLATGRDTCLQDHYLLYFMQQWFDIRSRTMSSIEVSFYHFPANMEQHRTSIEQCFGQAARIYGWPSGFDDDSRVFDPVFRPDDLWPPL